MDHSKKLQPTCLRIFRKNKPKKYSPKVKSACFETPLKWLGKLAIEDRARSLCNLNYPSQNYLTNKKKRPHRIMISASLGSIQECSRQFCLAMQANFGQLKLDTIYLQTTEEGKAYILGCKDYNKCKASITKLNIELLQSAN